MKRAKQQSTERVGNPEAAVTDHHIRARAYELFRARGSQPGHDIDDWLQAEYELRQLPIQHLAEVASSAPAESSSRRSALVSLVQLALILASSTVAYK